MSWVLRFGVPKFLAGVTILAAVTSLPDTIVSVRSAQAGKGVTSLGNVLGSNTSVLLFAILRTDLSITSVEAYTLLGAYCLFVAWIVAETVEVTHFIKGA